MSLLVCCQLVCCAGMGGTIHAVQYSQADHARDPCRPIGSGDRFCGVYHRPMNKVSHALAALRIIWPILASQALLAVDVR